MANPFRKMHGIPDRVLTGAVIHTSQSVASLNAFRRGARLFGLITWVWLLIVSILLGVLLVR
jgi:hypothetical protein